MINIAIGNIFITTTIIADIIINIVDVIITDIIVILESV